MIDADVGMEDQGGVGRYEKVSFEFCFNCDMDMSVLRMAGGNAFQSRGAERLKALLPMVERRAEGTVR